MWVTYLTMVGKCVYVFPIKWVKLTIRCLPTLILLILFRKDDRIQLKPIPLPSFLGCTTWHVLNVRSWVSYLSYASIFSSVNSHDNHSHYHSHHWLVGRRVSQHVKCLIWAWCINDKCLLFLVIMMAVVMGIILFIFSSILKLRVLAFHWNRLLYSEE